MKLKNFSKIYLTKDAENYPLTKKILKKISYAEKHYVFPGDLHFKPHLEPALITESKKNLFLTVRKENFIEKCPGTPAHLCCNYFVAKNILGCPADCSYCYLQAYINLKAVTIFVNTDDFLNDFGKKAAGGKFRIGTGEFSDSFFLDDLLNINKELIKICSSTESFLELKTKSAEVKDILGLEHKGRTVIAWSIAPEEIIKTEEKGSASLGERIIAAAKCAEAGYPVALHFDPLIYFPLWQKAYASLVENIFSVLPPKKVIWVSLGALRFHPHLKAVLYERFPDSKILFGEFIRGDDGKFRYLKYIRAEMFEKITGILRRFDKNMRIYLCMESPELWKSVFGREPKKIKNLNLIFG